MIWVKLKRSNLIMIVKYKHNVYKENTNSSGKDRINTLFGPNVKNI